MEKYLSIFKKANLFDGMSDGDILSVLKCMSSTKRIYSGNDYIFHEGDAVNTIGLVLKGSAHIVQDDFFGNRSILYKAVEADMFGEVYSLTNAPLNISVIAAVPSEILFLNVSKMLTLCSNACGFHNILIKNLVNIISFKNLLLTKKMQCITKRTTREKLLCYLHEQSRGRTYFEIPFNRQQLADYLSVERSAMSAELGRMRDDGLIDFNKNCFRIGNFSKRQ